MDTWMFKEKTLLATAPRPLNAQEMTSVSGGGNVANVVVGGSLGTIGGFFAGRIAGAAFGAAIGGPVGAFIGFGVSVGFGLAEMSGGGRRYRVVPEAR